MKTSNAFIYEELFKTLSSFTRFIPLAFLVQLFQNQLVSRPAWQDDRDDEMASCRCNNKY